MGVNWSIDVSRESCTYFPYMEIVKIHAGLWLVKRLT